MFSFEKQPEQSGFGESLERRVVFRFSAGLLRAFAGFTALMAVFGLAGTLYYSVPAAKPVTPPEPAEPALPTKPKLTLADVVAMKHSGEPDVVRRRPDENTAPASAQPESPDATALRSHLAKYRPLAEQLGVPWNSVERRVCAEAFYYRCYRWRNAVVRAGLSDLIVQQLFVEEDDPATRDQILTSAEQLFVTVAANASQAGDVFALRGKEGNAIFRDAFLAPMRALREATVRVRRMTPAALPAAQRVELAADVVPGAIAVAKESLGGTPARAQVVTDFATAFVRAEGKRLLEASEAIAAYRDRLRERESGIALARAAYEAKVAERQARRTLTIYGVGAGALGIVLLGVLLALLAIERHLRALRGQLVRPGAPRVLEPVEAGPDLASGT